MAGSASESEDEAEAELRMKFAAGPAGASAGGATGRPGSGRGGRRGGAAAAEADDGEEDEEWAQEQIRKGMGGLLPPGRGGSSAALAAEGETAAGGGGTASRAAATALAAGGGSQAAAIQAAADEVMRTLQAGLHRLQMSRQQAEKNLERTSTSLQVGTPPWVSHCPCGRQADGCCWACVLLLAPEGTGCDTLHSPLRRCKLWRSLHSSALPGPGVVWNRSLRTLRPAAAPTRPAARLPPPVHCRTRWRPSPAWRASWRRPQPSTCRCRGSRPTWRTSAACCRQAPAGPRQLRCACCMALGGCEAGALLLRLTLVRLGAKRKSICRR